MNFLYMFIHLNKNHNVELIDKYIKKFQEIKTILINKI